MILWWKKTSIEKKALVLLFSIISIFAVSRFFPLMEGARFSSNDLKNGVTISGEGFNLSGTTKNTKELYINDNPIPIDQKGNWQASLGLPSGYTVLTVKAYDRFGKANKKTYQLLVEKETTSPSIGANIETKIIQNDSLDSPPSVSNI